jgi:NitT/TauT family transport system permease protein
MRPAQLSAYDEQILAELAQPRAEPFRWADRPRLVGVISVVAVLLLWEGIGRRVNPLFFSYPTAIAGAAVEVLPSAEFLRQAWGSWWAFSVGLAGALVVGIFLGLLMGRYRLAEYLLDPYVYALDATPRVALIPLLLLWFGLGAPAKIAVVFLSGFFPVLMNTFSGVRTVSAGLVDIGRAYGASERQNFSKIIVPAALPFIMTGIRLGVGRALIGIVTAEMFTAVTGLGGLLIRYASALTPLSTAKFFIPVIFLALLGVVLSAAVAALQRRLAAWKESERAA